MCSLARDVFSVSSTFSCSSLQSPRSALASQLPLLFESDCVREKARARERERERERERREGERVADKPPACARSRDEDSKMSEFCVCFGIARVCNVFTDLRVMRTKTVT